MGEAEDIVDEEQHVLVFLVAEVFGHGEGGERHAHTGPRRLVHLAIHQGDLGFAEIFLVDDAGIGHFVVEVIALTGTLPHPGENRVAPVRFGDVVDELKNDDGLADAGATEGTGLTALDERTNEIDDLDPGFEDFGIGVLIGQRGGRAVNWVTFFVGDIAATIDGGAGDIKDATEHAFTDGHGNRITGVDHLHATFQSFGGRHGDRAGDAAPEVLLNLEREKFFFTGDLKCDGEGLVDRRDAVIGELNVDDGTDNLDDFAGITHGGRI